MQDRTPESPTLEQMLALEPAGEDRYLARLPGFGGVTLGCATLAAARTTDLSLHSLHVYFLRAVPRTEPALLRVSRIRDGRRFAHRRVEVCEGERVCCELVASFAAPAEGAEFDEPARDASPPPPESLPSEEEIAREERWDTKAPGPLGSAIEWRFVGGTPWHTAPSSHYQGWARPRAPLPKDRALHVAAQAFLADMQSHMPIARRLGGPFEPFGYTSLDQLVWIHRDEPWDDWRLVTTLCDVAHEGRAFTRRQVRARDGRLLASMAQEQLLPAPAKGGA
jgi:acyl-CoA thioesterase-2